jgi:hypothetical protein
MKKAKFIQDAKLYPSRYYRNPSDVVRDRRLTNADRLEILAAWERDARGRQNREESSQPDPLQLRRILDELQHSEEARRTPKNPDSAMTSAKPRMVPCSRKNEVATPRQAARFRFAEQQDGEGQWRRQILGIIRWTWTNAMAPITRRY